jgi:hypothetical protein
VRLTHSHRVDNGCSWQKEELCRISARASTCRCTVQDRESAYRRSHNNIYHGNVVEHITASAAERKVRPLKYDRVPASNEQDDDGSSVRAVEKDGAAGYVGIESDGWAQVEYAEKHVEECYSKDGVDGDVESAVDF